MKAIQFTAFGGSEVIRLNEVEKPIPKDNEVLIKVAATTVNPLDMKMRSGNMQQQMPVQLPYTPGLDVAGTVEAIGANVARLKVGDKVFGTTFGATYAGYISLNEGQVATIPANVNFGEAAALAIPLATAYSILIENGKLEAGNKILIHGAVGGVGSIAVQMAKALGAYVIGSASAKSIGMVKGFGADEVIDYTSQDFTQLVKDLDMVVDLVGGETQAKSFGVIKKGGKLLTTVTPPSTELAAQYGVQAVFVFSQPSYIKLQFGAGLVEEGKIKTNIAKTFKLEEAAQAQDFVSAGGADGKVVLIVE